MVRILNVENIGWKETSITRTEDKFYFTQGNKPNIDLLLDYLHRKDTIFIEFCPGKSPSIDTGFYYDMAFEYIPGLQSAGYDMWSFSQDVDTKFPKGFKTLIMYNSSAFAIYHLPDSPHFATRETLKIYHNPGSRWDDYYDDALPHFIQGMQDIISTLKPGDALIYLEDCDIPRGPYIPFTAPQLESLVQQKTFNSIRLHFHAYPVGIVIEKASGDNLN